MTNSQRKARGCSELHEGPHHGGYVLGGGRPVLGLWPCWDQLIGGVENWEPAARSLQANHPDAYVETRDIRKVDAAEVLRKAAVPAPISCLGSFLPGVQHERGAEPAHWSEVGGRRRNSLFLDFVRFVDALQPEWVVINNVRDCSSSTAELWRRK